MIREVGDAAPSTLAPFDDVIDVRSPAEFAEDHVPGAINLPVLSNAERAEVGTLYVQRSKFLARRVGASYVSRNIADHLAGPLADRSAAYTPLIYCWRGGQRSAAMATVLSQVGWRVGLLQGGYRTYRRGVVEALYTDDQPIRLVLLCGPTGVGKTAMLGLLSKRGVQTLDLEALAAHRGSLFGSLADEAQPSQKMFESRVAAALAGLDPERPVVVEAESSRIGDLRLPPRLWKAMCDAPGVTLEAPRQARVERIAATYGDLLQTPDRLVALLEQLPRHHSAETRSRWRDAARSGDADLLARDLIEAHYDPSYRRAASVQARRMLGEVAAGSTRNALEVAADELAALVAVANREQGAPRGLPENDSSTSP